MIAFAFFNFLLHITMQFAWQYEFKKILNTPPSNFQCKLTLSAMYIGIFAVLAVLSSLSLIVNKGFLECISNDGTNDAAIYSKKHISAKICICEEPCISKAVGTLEQSFQNSSAKKEAPEWVYHSRAVFVSIFAPKSQIF